MNKKLLMTTAVAVVLSACASKGNKSASTEEPSVQVGNDVQMTDTGLTVEEESFAIDETATLETGTLETQDILTPPAEVTLFFDFNSDLLTEDSKLSLIEHVEFLAASDQYRLILQGHADERGTREYNLALGLKRADSVRSYLMEQSVLPQQLESTSFGEEKLAVSNATNEQDHSLNRRVVLIYQPM